MKAVVRSRQDLNSWVYRVCEQLGDNFDKPYTVTIQKFHRPRTTDQNAKVHAMFRELARFTGHSEADVKDYIKAEFGPTRQVKIGKYTNQVPAGSSTWNVETCSMIIEELYRIGAEIGCEFTD